MTLFECLNKANLQASIVTLIFFFKFSFTNSIYFLADGDLGFYGNSLTAFMKQKHRLIWERRHGKIGSGRKDLQNAADSAEE